MKILCIGRNYLAHAKEMNSNVPKQPMIFMKPASAINPNDELEIPSFTQNLHFELEIVLKINKSGKNIALNEADQYYNQISLGIDFTARDVQDKCKEKGHPWEKAKAFDNSATVGKFLPKENFDLEALGFKLLQNGVLKQNGNSKDLIFKFDYLIHYASQYFSLNEGDLIFTGTPDGVGPVKEGDVLEAYLESNLLFKVNIN